MASTVTVTLDAGLTAKETLDSSSSPASGAGGNARTFNQYNLSGVGLSGSTTPKVDAPPVDLSHTLSGASGTLDLTAIPLARDVGQNTDLTGKKLVALLIKAPTGNTGPITIADGATNGYLLFGDASGQVTLKPGEMIIKAYQLSSTQAHAAVGASAKTIDISGTSGDKIEALAVFGT